jgi:predicted nucleic acid-binding protein
MSAYYDTGILLKLYTEEVESAAVRAFVTRRKKAIRINEMHRAECISAFRLKQFRAECTVAQASEAIGHIEEDIQAGVLKEIQLDWVEVWGVASNLANAHSGQVGCRTLDVLHIACAKVLHSTPFITSDRRQKALAHLVGLRVVNPLE